MKITDKAYALLLTGQTIGAELHASSPTKRAWVSVYPYVREKNRIGVEVEHRFRGVGIPILHVLMFEIDASAVEQPTYDYDMHMSDVRRVDVTDEAGLDESIRLMEQLVESRGVSPATLGPLGDDYPVI